MLICDTHAHYDDEAFDQDREILLGSELKAGGVEFVVNVGASMEGARASAAYARRYPKHGPEDGAGTCVVMYAGCGIHPDDTGVFEGKETSSGLRYSHPDDVMQELRDLCGQEGVVCEQKWFREQMRLAYELQLPINVHSRDAAQDTFDLIRENHDAGRNTGGIIHCYSGSLELAREYVKMGYQIGIGGVVTFKNAKTLKKVVQEIPLKFLVTETDCPYLAPEPHRGKRNDSRNIRYVIEAIAALKEMDTDTCAQALWENARNVYRI